MDEAAQLMRILSAEGTVSAAEKMSRLLQLDRLRDPRVVPFVLRLVVDEAQPSELRIHALRLLRNGRLACQERGDVADTLCKLLLGSSQLDLRLQAALALGEFTDVPRVLAVLGTVALADEQVDLRYAAFTSLQRGGATPECISLLQQLAHDETLGPAALRVLSSWPT
jgi:hypothetical protein